MGRGGGGWGGRVVQKKESETRSCIAVLKKNLLCRHIELSKGSNNAEEVLTQHSPRNNG